MIGWENYLMIAEQGDFQTTWPQNLFPSVINVTLVFSFLILSLGYNLQSCIQYKLATLINWKKNKSRKFSRKIIKHHKISSLNENAIKSILIWSWIEKYTTKILIMCLLLQSPSLMIAFWLTFIINAIVISNIIINLFF